MWCHVSRNLSLAAALVATLSLMRLAVGADVTISEFMAANVSTLADEDGDHSDWIEIHNGTEATVDLEGWFLTDSPVTPAKWAFPAVELDASAYLVVFASAKNRAAIGAELHTNFRLDETGEYLALVDRDGDVVDQFAPFFPPQENDRSYGASPGHPRGVLGVATPGEANVPFAPPPRFSPEGTATAAVEIAVELAAGSEDAVIRYTLNRSEPDTTSPIYTGPIVLSSTTMVTAAVFGPNGARSAPVSQSYVFIDPALESFDSNLPLIVLETRRRSVSEDVARLSFVTIFDVDHDSGRAGLVGSPSFAGAAGLRIRGASSTELPKKQFALEIWDAHDRDRAVSLLGMPADSDWVLHAPYEDKTLMRNYLAYAWFARMGHTSVRTRFVEVFLDTGNRRINALDYVGVYVLTEKIKRGPHRVDIAPLERWHDAEPEISGGYIFKHDRLDPGDSGFTTESGRRVAYVEPKERELTLFQRAWVGRFFNAFEDAVFGHDFASPERGYAAFMDVDSIVDYNLHTELTKNIDGQSTFLHKDRQGKLAMGPLWDFNRAIGLANQLAGYERAGWQLVFHLQNWPTWFEWLERVLEDPAFQARRRARWTELRRDTLSTERIHEEIESIATLLDEAQARNFERWPVLGVNVWVNWFVGQTYREEVDWMKQWVADRAEWMDSELLRRPEFSPAGGRIEPGTTVTLSAPAGEIFYTLDGSDPRSGDGEVSSTAFLYDGEPLKIDSSVEIQARARIDGVVWSGASLASYFVSVPALALTEIMYQPEGGTSFEYIELQNVGEEPIELEGVTFTRGLIFEFSARALQPGAHVVVVRDLEAFATLYDTSAIFVAGEYRGSLSNTAEFVALEGALGEPILGFSYRSSWQPATAGQGYSLVLRDPASSPEIWEDGSSWRASADAHGSPGRPDPEPGEGQIAGDANQDGRLNLSDPLRLAILLFSGTGEPLPCSSGARGENATRDLLDVNGDLLLDGSDVVFLLTYLFLEGDAPADGLGCRRVVACPEVCDSD